MASLWTFAYYGLVALVGLTALLLVPMPTFLQKLLVNKVVEHRKIFILFAAVFGALAYSTYFNPNSNMKIILITIFYMSNQIKTIIYAFRIFFKSRVQEVLW